MSVPIVGDYATGAGQNLLAGNNISIDSNKINSNIYINIGSITNTINGYSNYCNVIDFEMTITSPEKFQNLYLAITIDSGKLNIIKTGGTILELNVYKDKVIDNILLFSDTSTYIPDNMTTLLDTVSYQKIFYVPIFTPIADITVQLTLCNTSAQIATNPDILVFSQDLYLTEK
jgi:hypothetical protein